VARVPDRAGILLPALFPTSGSITHLLTGRDELPFLAASGGWLSLIAFVVLAYSLIRLPLRRRKSTLNAGD
jgi:hypothetical protein